MLIWALDFVQRHTYNTPEFYGSQSILMIFRGQGEGDEGEGRRSFYSLQEDHSHGGGGRR